jgi:hypothetical protein
MRLLFRSMLIAASALAASCSTAPPPAPQASMRALPVMERVALGANACWFKSRDPAFRKYRLAPELNSFSGTPRILLVPAHSPESRPLLVVQASGERAKLSAFGPLMQDASMSGRINADVLRWARGGKGC